MAGMDGETKRFVASRLTTGNRIFPTEITVSPVQVLKTKRSWFSSDEESISLRHVSSVRIKTGLMFSDIWVESSGGTNQIYSHGHTKGDAQKIKRTIEEYQLAFRDTASETGPRERAGHPDGSMKKCPFCAESGRAEAKVCRYCGHELV